MAPRRHRRLMGKKLFSAADIHKLLHQAGVDMRCWILLGINCAYGPTDMACLPLEAVDLNSGWIKYERRKNEVERDCPLWPETVAAMKVSLNAREGRGGEFFLNASGRAFEQTTLCKRFRQVYSWAGFRKAGLYYLRHTFQTVGDGAMDPVAVKALMGHIDNSMSGTYREEVQEERLRAVVDHIRAWLFQATPVATPGI